MILDDGGREIIDGADVCIVGAGPVGIALALECERRGLSVTVLESGCDGFDGVAQTLSNLEIVDPRHHASSELTVRRALGGTSLIWSGRCVPYDSIDFEQRAYVPGSGWPIGPQDIAPYYGVATRHLDCGSPTFRAAAAAGSPRAEEIRLDSLERWSRQVNSRLAHAQALGQSARLRIHLRCTVVDFELDADGGRLEGLVVACGESRRRVGARHYVLAGGGIESTRLLLHAQTRWPRKFGGIDGPLGRYYQGHVFGRLADIVFHDRTMASQFDYLQDDKHFYTRRRLTIDADVQRREQLLNIAFLPDNPWFYDHRHGSGILSLIYLLLACEPIGGRLLAEAIRLQQIGPEPRSYGPHLRNIVVDLPGTVLSGLRIARQRFLQPTRKPGFLDNRRGCYPLYYISEHAPHPDSRVCLSGQRDVLGLPRLSVDIRFADGDADSVVRAHALLDVWLRRQGIGQLNYHVAAEQRAGRVLDQACDGYHQIGLTRMSISPRDGIVDINCKVHDVANLFVASSAVFPTSGQANPTLLATAMAARLAGHIDTQCKAYRAPVGGSARGRDASNRLNNAA